MDYELTFEKYNKFVASEDRSMVSHDITSTEVEVLALSNAFGGEAGELQNIVKKIISKNLFYATYPNDIYTEAFLHEAGDVLWYLVRLVQKAGFTMEEVMQKNIDKLQKKYNTGVDQWREK